MQAQSSHLAQDPSVHHKNSQILTNKGWDSHDVLLVYLSFTQMKSTQSHSDALLLFPLLSSHPAEINLEALGTVNIQVYKLSMILIT